MDIINVNSSNIEKEHICCAMTTKKDDNSVELKKSWLKNNFENGLIFKKANIRGKVFIEYIKSEYAWVPIEAKKYFYINCLWVSGQYKGQGISNQLLNKCITDAKKQNLDGLVILSSKKKMPYLSDPKYLKYKGFLVADTVNPFYELLYLPFEKNNNIPKFKDCAKEGKTDDNNLTIYFTNQCPHSEKYVLLAKQIADNKNIKMNLVKFTSFKEAQNSPAPFTTYSLFFNGNFVTNEILSEKKFELFLNNNFNN